MANNKIHYHISESYGKCENCETGNLVSIDGTKSYIRKKCTNEECGNVEIFSTSDGSRASTTQFQNSITRRR
jgi:hypothetical protein